MSGLFMSWYVLLGLQYHRHLVLIGRDVVLVHLLDDVLASIFCLKERERLIPVRRSGIKHYRLHDLFVILDDSLHSFAVFADYRGSHPRLGNIPFVQVQKE